MKKIRHSNKQSTQSTLLEELIAKLAGEPKHLVMSMASITLAPDELKEVIESYTTKKVEEEMAKVVEVLKSAAVQCSGSCGAGCEIAVEDLIDSLTKDTSKEGG